MKSAAINLAALVALSPSSCVLMPNDAAPLPPVVEPLFENPITEPCGEFLIAWYARHALVIEGEVVQPGSEHDEPQSTAEVATLRYEYCPWTDPGSHDIRVQTENRDGTRSTDVALVIVREYDSDCFQCFYEADPDTVCPADAGVVCDDGGP